MKKILFLFVTALIFITGCKEEPPLIHDGDGVLNLSAVWDASTDSIPNYIPLANAKVILNSMYGMSVFYTNSEGCLKLDHLPSAKYSVSIKAPHPQDPSINLVGAARDLSITSGEVCSPIITTKAVSSSGIAINEIYCTGPVNNIFYFYDLYLELYNSSDSTKYLDGMMVMRVSGNNTGLGPGADEGEDGDIDGATYVYKFPGKPGEKNYPFYSKEFMILAGDATDHRKVISNSIDLSNAKWEFYNQYMAADLDNPNVPNITNLRSDNPTKFLISLTGDVVVLASGIDSVWNDGIDIASIIDAVQYASSATKRKTIDDRIERGLVICSPKYSGQSMQRREPGNDTNDGSLDWEVIPAPTPGRQ